MNERQLEILNYLKIKKSLSMEEVSKYVNSSRSTVRRDIVELEELGAVKRGKGKVFIVQSNSITKHYKIRINENVKAKERITSVAAENFLRDGLCMFIDGSTTAMKLCKHLKNFSDITVVTNGLEAANMLAEMDNVMLFLTGGYYRKGFGELTGEPAIEYVKQFKVDICFFSCGGIDQDGVYEASLQRAWLKKEMLKNAAQKVLLCDSSKFEHNLKYRLCDFNDIDYIITEKEPPLAMKKIEEKFDTEFIIA